MLWPAGFLPGLSWRNKGSAFSLTPKGTRRVNLWSAGPGADLVQRFCLAARRRPDDQLLHVPHVAN